MSEIRYYTVRQEREVKVSAPSALDAAIVANAAFEGKDPPSDELGRTRSEIRIRDIDVREDI